MLCYIPSALPNPNNLRTVVGEGRALHPSPAVGRASETWQNNLRTVVSRVLGAAFPPAPFLLRFL